MPNGIAIQSKLPTCTSLKTIGQIRTISLNGVIRVFACSQTETSGKHCTPISRNLKTSFAGERMNVCFTATIATVSEEAKPILVHCLVHNFSVCGLVNVALIKVYVLILPIRARNQCNLSLFSSIVNLGHDRRVCHSFGRERVYANHCIVVTTNNQTFTHEHIYSREVHLIASLEFDNSQSLIASHRCIGRSGQLKLILG